MRMMMHTNRGIRVATVSERDRENSMELELIICCAPLWSELCAIFMCYIIRVADALTFSIYQKSHVNHTTPLLQRSAAIGIISLNVERDRE